MQNKIPSWLKTLLKLAFTALCLWYVGKKIDWNLSYQLLKSSNKWWLILALIFIAVSKIASSFRLNIYFKKLNIYLNNYQHLKLYGAGMFYNLFLPGGIGGDAYKVIVLNKNNSNVSAKKIGAAVLLDRLCGVVALGALAAIFFALSFQFKNYSWCLLLAIIPGIFIYQIFCNKIFPSFKTDFWPVMSWAFLVQLLQVFAMYFILYSIHSKGNFNQLQLLFLVSSIATMLPVTIGPFGARQLVFLWGANMFHLNATEAVYASLLFDVFQMIVAATGVKWALFGSPLFCGD